jgi:hypothetical protein
MKLGNTKVIAAMILTVVLALLFSINVANAQSPLNVSLGVPSTVDIGVPFLLSITVTNKTAS